MGVEDEQPKWKPRPVADAVAPIEIGNRASFISKEKRGRMTKKLTKYKLFLLTYLSHHPFFRKSVFRLLLDKFPT